MTSGPAAKGFQPREVVLVHGLWYGTAAMAVLRRRLRFAGLDACSFAYASRSATLEGHAAALAAWLRGQAGAQFDFVCHSLGGLVALKMLEQNALLPAGRMVLLGTPLHGSETARRALQLPGGRWAVGRIAPALVAGYGPLPQNWQIGMISGDKAFGLGRLVGLRGDGDGTVLARETTSAGLADRIELPVTHTGMLYSSRVAHRVVAFLRTGRF